MHRLASRLALSILASSPLASAQFTIHEQLGDDNFGYLGWSLASAGDMNGDGVNELLLGERGGLGGTGAVQVLSGQDLSLLHEVGGLNDLDYFGQSVGGLGDVDGDGRADFAVGAPRNQFPTGCCPGYVQVISGASGDVLHTINAQAGFVEFGGTLVGPGDLSGDGVPDLVVGDPWHSNRGAVHAYSGASGALLYSVTGTETVARFGQDLTAAGDWNGDGRADYLVSADRHGASDQGMAWVLSGSNGAVLLQIPSPVGTNDASFGQSVTTMGDVSGDSVVDFLIAATGVGRAYLISGADGAVLHTLVHPVDSFSSSRNDFVSRVGDADGDGLSDALVGGAGVRIFSSATGAELLHMTGADGFGYGVASPGDIVGDGLPEIMVAALLDDTGGSNAGRVDVIRLAPSDASSYCTAASNSAGAGCVMGTQGSTSIAINDLALTASGGPPGQPALFYYGSGSTETPFGDGFRCVNGSVVVRLSPALAFDGGGEVLRPLDFTTAPLSSGPGGVSAGSTWYMQLWYRDPGAASTGFNLSDGLALTFSS